MAQKSHYIIGKLSCHHLITLKTVKIITLSADTDLLSQLHSNLLTQVLHNFFSFK